MKPHDADYAQRTRDSFVRQQAMATLGATLLGVEPGKVVLGMAHRASLTQQHGFLHAGMLSAALDSACGYAAFTLMPPDDDGSAEKLIATMTATVMTVQGRESLKH